MLKSLKVSLLAAGLLLLSIGFAYAAGVRSYVSGNFVLNLDSSPRPCGFLKSVDGGETFAEVINEPAGPSQFTKKHIGLPRYEEFTLQFGFSMSREFYDWISGFWAMNNTPMNGSITAYDYQLTPKSARAFNNAFITEITIPACDGSNKEPAYMSVKFAPEYITGKPASGSSIDSYLGKAEQKVWLPSNFRLSIDGLDCTKVSKIDSFTVKQTVITDITGDARDQQKGPGKIEFPNLVITMPESAAQSWINWHKSFVIEGNNDEAQEKGGTLVFLSPNHQTELAQIEFFNLGICRLDKDKTEANADQIKRVKVTLYCERMVFTYLNKMISGGSGDSGSSNTASSTTPTLRSNTSTAPGKAQEPNDDCQLGVNYSLGPSNPINLTVNSIEYTAERRKVGNEYRRPNSDQKMVVVHYTLQNPSNTSLNVGSGSIDWTLQDENSVNYQRERYPGVEGSGVVLSQSLAPGQSVRCFACFPMPAKGKALRLLALAHGESKNQATYRLEDKMTSLPVLYADAADSSGSTRCKVVEGKIGQAYQVLDYDIKVDGIEYTTQPISNLSLQRGQQFMLMTVEYTNFAGAGYAVAGNNIEVIDQNSQSYRRAAVLAANTVTVITPKPDLEETTKFRLAFIVPKDIKPQCINLRDSFRPMVRIEMQGSAPLLESPRKAG